jgi:hypothetical protein
MLEIFVDADACPVKQEVYVVAARYDLRVVLVANQSMHTPRDLDVVMMVVAAGPDVADDWIAEHVEPGDVVITADIPLAARCLEKGTDVLGTDGRPFTEDMIGSALASRQLNADLREMGVGSRGPSALSGKERSRFLSRLDEMVQRGLQAGRS